MLNKILEAIRPELVEIIVTVVGIIVSYVTVKVKALYEKKVNTEQKKEIVKTVVEMVEQIAKSQGWTSAQKFEEARKNALEWLNSVGIKITELELRALIESAVNSFNQTIKNK